MNTPATLKTYHQNVSKREYNGDTTNQFPNRRMRRSKPDRFISNGKNFHLTITGESKYHRQTQEIYLYDKTVTMYNKQGEEYQQPIYNGKIKQIYHYRLKGINY